MDPIIKSTPLKPVLMRAYCPKCGSELKSILVLLTNPSIYEHKCTNSSCNYVIDLEDQYPKIGYEEIKNEQQSMGEDKLSDR